MFARLRSSRERWVITVRAVCLRRYAGTCWQIKTCPGLAFVFNTASDTGPQTTGSSTDSSPAAPAVEAGATSRPAEAFRSPQQQPPSRAYSGPPAVRRRSSEGGEDDPWEMVQVFTQPSTRPHMCTRTCSGISNRHAHGVRRCFTAGVLGLTASVRAAKLTQLDLIFRSSIQHASDALTGYLVSVMPRIRLHDHVRAGKTCRCG